MHRIRLATSLWFLIVLVSSVAAPAEVRYTLGFNAKLRGLEGLDGKPIKPGDISQRDHTPYDAAVGLAKGHMQAENWVEATTELERAIGIRETAGAHAMLGLVHSQTGDVRQATASLQRAATLAKDGRSSKLHQTIAVLLAKQKRYDDALRTIQVAIEDAPTDPKLWAFRAMWLTSTYQYEAAADAAERVLQLAPDNTTLFIPATAALLRAEHFDRCLEVTAAASERFPEDLAVADLRVRCLYECRDRPEAAPLLLPAAQHYSELTDRQSGDALKLLADALTVSGQVGEAISTYREALPLLDGSDRDEVESMLRRLELND